MGAEEHVNALEKGDDAKEVIVAVIRTAFPHQNIPDGPYERVADKVMEAAAGDAWMRVKLYEGLESLNALAGGEFTALDPETALTVLQRIPDIVFFRFIRQTTIVNLYEDEEVWEVLGYEGPSFDKGGYVDRGFDDLDWLPDPRITEYDGPEEWHDVVDALPRSSATMARPTRAAVPAGETSARGGRASTGGS